MSDQRIYVIGHRPDRKQLRETHIIYDYYKIGISKNVSKRVSILRGGTPHTLDLLTTIKSDDPVSVENYLHRIAAFGHINDEWFSYNVNLVNSLIALNRLNHNTVKQVYHNYFDAGPRETLYILTHRARNGELETPEVVL